MQWKPWIVFRNIISGYRLNATAITKVDLTFKTLAFLQSTKLMSYLSRILLSLRRSNSHLFYVSYWARTDTGDCERVCHSIFITYAVRFGNSLCEFSHEDKLVKWLAMYQVNRHYSDRGKWYFETFCTSNLTQFWLYFLNGTKSLKLTNLARSRV